MAARSQIYQRYTRRGPGKVGYGSGCRGLRPPHLGNRLWISFLRCHDSNLLASLSLHDAVKGRYRGTNSPAAPPGFAFHGHLSCRVGRCSRRPQPWASSHMRYTSMGKNFKSCFRSPSMQSRYLRPPPMGLRRMVANLTAVISRHLNSPSPPGVAVYPLSWESLSNVGPGSFKVLTAFSLRCSEGVLPLGPATALKRVWASNCASRDRSHEPSNTVRQ